VSFPGMVVRPDIAEAAATTTSKEPA